MPHKQKENHNHSSKSKKERQRIKQEALERKQTLVAARVAADADADAGEGGNLIPLVEGHGAYEIGCEPEREYNFNINKRSKKHLRNDLRRKIHREEQEEEERLQRAREEQYRVDNAEESVSEEEEEEEEEVVTEEYFIYICECCDKKYATKNQFLNHSKSKKHRDKVRIYEELGLIVTHVELRGENGNEGEAYDDDEEDTEGLSHVNADTEDDGQNDDHAVEEEDDDDDDEEQYQPKRSVFAAFADDSSSSSESSEDDDDDDDEEDRTISPAPPVTLIEKKPAINSTEDLVEDGIDFEELIHQNQLVQNEIDAEKNANGTIAVIPDPVPLPYNGTYDPKDYGVNENRLASVHHRLQKRLAAKGIEPSQMDSYAPSDAISMGKTLLQQVMEANIDTLQAKLDAYNRHKKECELLGREFAQAEGNSKALPAQYIRKKDAADDSRKRANVHHAGSHYHMQASRSMQFGRSKGLMARHSSQGARLQASRMAATETARMQSGGGGMKMGKKTSKKSNMKRQGDAGGSKKSGGGKGDGEM